MSKAPEDQLSAGESFQSVGSWSIHTLVYSAHASLQYMQLNYTLGPEVTSNPYHSTTVRTSMTRHIGTQFDDMRDEMVRAFRNVLPQAPLSNGGSELPLEFSNLIITVNTEWVGVRMYESILEITSRISARLAVGYPLCKSHQLRVSYKT